MYWLIYWTERVWPRDEHMMEGNKRSLCLVIGDADEWIWKHFSQAGKVSISLITCSRNSAWICKYTFLLLHTKTYMAILIMGKCQVQPVVGISCRMPWESFQSCQETAPQQSLYPGRKENEGNVKAKENGMGEITQNKALANVSRRSLIFNNIHNGTLHLI